MQKLCPQPQTKTILSESYELDYPNSQELTFNVKTIAKTDLDSNSPWYRVCYPIMELDTPNRLVDSFSLLRYDENEALARI